MDVKEIISNRDYDYNSLPFTNDAEFFTPPLGPDCPTDEDVAEARKIYRIREEGENEQKANTLLRCDCGHTQKIRDSVYVQTMYNSQCDWHEGEGQVLCEGCDTRMRLDFKCEELQGWKGCFKEVVTVSERE